jgi:hypothetical protein
MSKVFTGKDGRLLILGVEQAKVTNWTITGNVEMLETTTLADVERTFVPGVQEFNGNATLLYYTDDSGRNDAATILRTVLKTGGVSDNDYVGMRLRFKEGNIDRDIQIFCYITSVTVGASVGEVSSAQISFQVTGPLRSVTL